MSSAALVKSSAEPPNVTACPSVCVPLFGGFWIKSESVTASTVYCVVVVVFGWLFV